MKNEEPTQSYSSTTVPKVTIQIPIESQPIQNLKHSNRSHKRYPKTNWKNVKPINQIHLQNINSSAENLNQF